MRLTLLVCVSSAHSLLAGSCEMLSSLALPDTTITSAKIVAADSFIAPGQQAPTARLPEFCRIEARIRPTRESDIRIEVWMPTTNWNGKFQGIGNGGFAGTISYGPTGLPAALRRGYAAAATDTGHTGTATDASWALKHPEQVIDFGHRAIHLMTLRAKSIIQAFYGEGPRKSYFSSCSNGGRQALMEAQRYPADYDGIIAGAPANDFTTLMVNFIWNMQALAKAPISMEKLTLLETAVLQKCDSTDGLTDGILSDPKKCMFDPATVLTAEESKAIGAIYSGPRTPKGKEVFPGFPPGAETGPGGWGRWITEANAMQTLFATSFLRHMIFEDPNYDPLRFDLERDLGLLQKKAGETLNAPNPDLRAFQKRGGKLILWHGWNDPAIPAQNTIYYFEQVRRKLGAKESDSFMRLYMAPGVQHCGGGPGPNSFGASNERGAEMFQALESWVEDDLPPAQIIATKLAADAMPASEIKRTRPLCPYPQVARYNGSGSIDEAANFTCAQP